MLTIGDKFPEFNLQACVSREKGKEFEEITNASYEGKWKIVNVLWQTHPPVVEAILKHLPGGAGRTNGDP